MFIGLSRSAFEVFYFFKMTKTCLMYMPILIEKSPKKILRVFFLNIYHLATQDNIYIRKK